MSSKYYLQILCFSTEIGYREKLVNLRKQKKQNKMKSAFLQQTKSLTTKKIQNLIYLSIRITEFPQTAAGRLVNNKIVKPFSSLKCFSTLSSEQVNFNEVERTQIHLIPFSLNKEVGTLSKVILSSY